MYGYNPYAAETAIEETEDVCEILVSEDTKVLYYLHERFTALGFDALQATTLAVMGADWQKARAYINAGCSHELAVRILR